ncbi:MAG: hypothetical protein WKF87_11645 [Chryseolinea sp.]
MSSHHFVKEGQEPALLILDADLTDAVASLLEWAPLVIVSSEALPNVLLWGIKIDIIIHHQDALLGETELLLKDHGPVSYLNCKERSEAFETTLMYLTETGQSTLNVVTSNTGPLFEQSHPFSQSILITIFEGCWKSSVITAGVYEKWLPERTILKVYQDEALDSIELDGLSGSGPEYEAESSGMVAIKSRRPFLVSEQFC